MGTDLDATSAARTSGGRPWSDQWLQLVDALRAHVAEVSDTLASELIEQLSSVIDPAQGWLVGTQLFFERGLSFDVHVAWHALLASRVPGAALPVWQPDVDALTESNLARFVRARGFQTYAELYAWSVAHPADYWQATLTELGLRFEVPPVNIRTEVCEPSSSASSESVGEMERTRWLEGALLNVARACLEGEDDSLAVIYSRCGETIHCSKGELKRRVGRAAAGLQLWGVSPGKSVAVAVPLGIEAVVSYLALLHVGAVVVCIAESYSELEIAVRLRIIQPDYLIVGDVVRRAGKSLPLYEKFAHFGAPAAVVRSERRAAEHRSSQAERSAETGVALDVTPLRSGDVEWSSLAETRVANERPERSRVEPHGEILDPFPTSVAATNTVLFSSGTTGSPKAIPWTPECALKAAADARWHLDVRKGDRLLWPTSLGWMMGAWSIFATLLNGATLVLYDDAPTLRGLGELVETARVTHLGVVPSLVRSWRETRTMEGLDWSHVRLFASTGECSNPTDMLYLMWLARYRPVIEYCGGTEIAGGYVTGTLLTPCVPSCFTTPALGQAFVCLDDEGNETRVGEAFLTLPSIGLSTTLLNRNHHAEYYADTPRHNLRRHGDLIEWVNETYCRVLGRADDTMNLGGVKVSAAELERACEGVGGVREVAAIAVPPPSGGPSQLVMCVVFNAAVARGAAADSLRHELQARIRERVNPLFKVDRLVLMDGLPRTASNKVMRRILRDRASEPNDGAIAPPPLTSGFERKQT